MRLIRSAIMRHQATSTSICNATHDAQIPQDRDDVEPKLDIARYHMIGLSDQPHEFLGCNDFFGQGSTRADHYLHPVSDSSVCTPALNPVIRRLTVAQVQLLVQTRRHAHTHRDSFIVGKHTALSNVDVLFITSSSFTDLMDERHSVLPTRHVHIRLVKV